jgi:arginine:ornithine antiporter/lysine permease
MIIRKEKKDLGILSLTALVVGSIIGSGVFNLMRDMSANASLIAILIGWAITGVGMIFLALCFRNLNKKRPDLDAGIYSYAEAGFGKFMGFNSAWGYWISAWIGNVAYATLMFSSLGYFFKIFGNGQNLASVIGASVVLWLGHILILRGVKSASFINVIVTLAKIIPIFIFIIAAFLAFKLNIFTSDIWGTASKGFELSSIVDQVKSTMLVTVWVFIGIEGAVVFSGRSKKRSDISKATFLGLFTVLAIYALVTVLSLGIMTHQDLANLSKPAMAALLEHVVGPWGAALVNIGVIISIMGAWLAWTMFAFELPYQAAKKEEFPAFFAKENKHGTPYVALLITNLLVQLFIFSFLISGSAYNFTYSLATSAILIPYALTAFYQLKYSIIEKGGTKDKIGNIIIGLVASIYAVWLIYAAGIDYLLLTVLVYLPGVIVYVIMRIHQKRKIFTPIELVIALAFVALGAFAIYKLATGQISI